MKKQNGFTLIELIVTVAILGVMAGIAVPSYSGYIIEQRQSSAYNNLVGMISMARIEAIKRSRVVTLCISSDQSTCDTTATDWNDGWIVFSDVNGDGVVNTTSDPDDVDDTILKIEPASSPGVTITSDEFGYRLSIAPRGRLKDQGAFVICDSSGEDENAMALNLWVTGLGRLATDSDSDGTVEYLDGTEVSCP